MPFIDIKRLNNIHIKPINSLSLDVLIETFRYAYDYPVHYPDGNPGFSDLRLIKQFNLHEPSKFLYTLENFPNSLVNIDCDESTFYVSINHPGAPPYIEHLASCIYHEFTEFKCFVIENVCSPTYKWSWFPHDILRHGNAVIMCKRDTSCVFHGFIRDCSIQIHNYNKNKFISVIRTLNITIHKSFIHILFDQPIMYPHLGADVFMNITHNSVSVSTDTKFPRWNKLIIANSNIHELRETEYNIFLTDLYTMCDDMFIFTDNIYKTHIGENELFRNFALYVVVLLNHKARVIQTAWKKSIGDPTYSLCRKRLLREFQEFNN
jgi:hypothetical protein